MYLLDEDHNFKLIYDFSKEAGDIIQELKNGDLTERWTVEKVDTVKSDEHFCRRLHVKSETFDETGQLLPEKTKNTVWVSGIGGRYHWADPFAVEEDYNIHFLFCSFADGHALDTSLFLLDSYSGIAKGRMDKAPDGQLFDLNGRRLKEAPQRGIYIKDGRKVSN